METQSENRTTRGPGRPKLTSDEAQRAHVLEATGRLLQEIGYGKSTMDLVAARAGVSKRTLYRLFPSKTALFRELIAIHRRTMIALPGDYDGMTLQEALTKIFYVELPADEDLKRLQLLRVLMRESESDPEFRSFAVVLGRDTSRQLLRDWLAVQVKRGRLRIANADVASNILMDMMFGHLDVSMATETGTVRPISREAYLRQAIEIFLRGAENAPSPR